MRQRLKELGILAVIVAIGGGLTLVSGIVPVKASSGHWPITAWLLNFASDRSVALHSVGVEVPNLDQPRLVTLGAATYESNCKFCHGQPGERQPPVALGMTPKPPQLADAVPELDDSELFYILKHGIKFAGMPAWPTQRRDDEIWPVVAFLRQLPSMDNQAYLELLRHREFGSAPETPLHTLVATRCAACHGIDGGGRGGPRVPVLAGQSQAYLRQSLLAYRGGTRYSGVMMPIAHRLTDQQIDLLAEYFAERRSQSDTDDDSAAKASAQSDLRALGERLAQRGDRADKIPSCVDCHGPADTVRHDDYPRLAGQPSWYIQHQLELFAERTRGGTGNASLMHPVADKLDDKQREALAAYYASISDPEIGDPARSPRPQR